ncbi:MAG: hypothetical protein A2X41_12585 [Candidatus Margulisbacteria bacterium GWE2_39_32]|nr:MAG: hypothetical protein A2X41_12585 [Candidatus Margulisbacteria bacterium GWE2_39_32]
MTRFPVRKLNLLSGYDYGCPNSYFITINAKNRIPYFGEIYNGEMIQNTLGQIINKQRHLLFDQYGYLKMDVFIIIPDHVHAIIHIVGNGRYRSLHHQNNLFGVLLPHLTG